MRRRAWLLFFIGIAVLLPSMALFSWLVPRKMDTSLALETSQSTPNSADHAQPYSPYVDLRYPTHIYWGETHLHTAYSPDAGLVGTRLDPDEAFRFARGEELKSSTGQPVRLERPFDWMVVSDHSEYLGLPQALAEENPVIMNTESGKRWAAALKQGGEAGYKAFVELTAEFAKAQPSVPRDALTKLVQITWERSIAAAEKNNIPGLFSAFIGYEWTQSLDGDNLHRTVVFRDGSDKVKQILPFSEFDGVNPMALWGFLADYEKNTGGRALTIAHNSNLSAGLMFSSKTEAGQPIDLAYAKMRSRFEPLVEVTQSKGDSETTIQLSPDDQFANFERWNKANIFGLVATTEEMLPYNYVRSALRLGLEHEAKLGVNPFKVGMIGASDQHTGLTTTRAENYFGVAGIDEPKPDRWKELFMKSEISPDLNMYMWEMLPGGLTGVWAQKNTRESIWDALYRREVYATTGTRPTIRVFGGWDFKKEDIQKPDPEWVQQGYALGVPMGGELTNPSQSKAPTFMVKAAYDPDGAFLDRIQIVKGWLDSKGATHEKVFDVAWSGDRKPDPITHQVPLVGSTVDVKNATWTNAIGAPLLIGFWQDPDFDPTLLAFYYVRVIEIPTPRWTDYDVKRLGAKMDKNVPMTVTNRAYTSPIWYSPTKK